MSNRLTRQLAPVLIGVIASVSAHWTATALRANACLDAGGRWDAAARACEAAAGGVAPDPGMRPYLIGGAVGVALLVVLWRTYTYFVLRAARGGGGGGGSGTTAR
jgi:hypothetical protein